MAAVVAIMVIGGGALITDHVSLVDQRDTLKAASDAAGIAAAQHLKQVLADDPGIGDTDLEAELVPLARRYILANLLHLSESRYRRAVDTLVVEVTPDREQSTVDVSVKADMGGFLFSAALPFLGGVEQIDAMKVETRVESVKSPIEVVLAIDISQSMENGLDGRWVRDPDDSRMGIVKRASKSLVRILAPSRDNRIAVAAVPWHIVVRLDDDARQKWIGKLWAEYPGSRRYAAPYWCMPTDRCTPPAVDQSLPVVPGEPWRGCLDEQRIRAGGHAALPASSALLASPAAAAFAQAFFPAPFGASYHCIQEPLPEDFRQQFCYDGAPISHYLQAHKPPQHGCAEDMPSILPLTSDDDAIEDAIDALEPVGLRTYSSLGVLWGQRMVSHSWQSVWGGDVHPVDPDDDDNTGTRKAIVLLTDGEDNYCGWFDPHCSNGVGVPRATACAAAKAQGTEIFVIAAMQPDRVSSDLAASLRDCSSADGDADSPYVFLNNATPASLEAAFADIASQLVTVRRVY